MMDKGFLAQVLQLGVFVGDFCVYSKVYFIMFCFCSSLTLFYDTEI